jgi:hypothetical protein
MSQEERPGKDDVVGRDGQDSPSGQDVATDTGSYAHQDLVAMMRRRRDAEEKLRQRHEEAASRSKDGQEPAGS